MATLHTGKSPTFICIPCQSPKEYLLSVSAHIHNEGRNVLALSGTLPGANGGLRQEATAGTSQSGKAAKEETYKKKLKLQQLVQF